jgi:hypothetical protein
MFGRCESRAACPLSRFHVLQFRSTWTLSDNLESYFLLRIRISEKPATDHPAPPARVLGLGPSRRVTVPRGSHALRQTRPGRPSRPAPGRTRTRKVASILYSARTCREDRARPAWALSLPIVRTPRPIVAGRTRALERARPSHPCLHSRPSRPSPQCAPTRSTPPSPRGSHTHQHSLITEWRRASSSGVRAGRRPAPPPPLYPPAGPRPP